MDNHKLTFRSNKSLVKLARETIKEDSFKIAYSKETTKDKCFYLVKDDGIYLMNSYLNKGDNQVVYASGYNPKYNDNVWEDSYQVSSDDFADNMYFTDDQLERIAGGGDIDITITPNSYEVRA